MRIMPLITGAVIAAACSIPGLAPEDKTQTTSASAPAPRDPVYQRARSWFTGNGYTITSESNGNSINGYRVIATTDGVETRAVVEFRIASSSATLTSFSVQSHTEHGVPPRLSTLDVNAPAAELAPESLAQWLMCPAATWPACP